MHRTILTIFGLNIVFFGMCNMARAKSINEPVEAVMMCHAVSGHSGNQECAPTAEIPGSAYDRECAGGTCFVKNLSGNPAVSPGDTGSVNSAAIPVHENNYIPVASETSQSERAVSGLWPPGFYSDQVLRL